MYVTYGAARAIGNDEECLNIVVPKVRVPVTAIAWFHFVIVSEAHEGLLGDVHASGTYRLYF